MASYGKIEQFVVEKDDGQQQYAEKLHHYFLANEITEQDKRRNYLS